MEGKSKKKIIIIAVAAVAVIAVVVAAFIIRNNSGGGEQGPKPVAISIDGEEIVLNKTTLKEYKENGWKFDLDLKAKPDGKKEQQISDAMDIEKNGKVFNVVYRLYGGQTNGEATISDISVKNGTVAELKINGKTAMLGKDTVNDMLNNGWELADDASSSDKNSFCFDIGKEFPIYITVSAQDGKAPEDCVIESVAW